MFREKCQILYFRDTSGRLAFLMELICNNKPNCYLVKLNVCFLDCFVMLTTLFCLFWIEVHFSDFGFCRLGVGFLLKIHSIRNPLEKRLFHYKNQLLQPFRFPEFFEKHSTTKPFELYWKYCLPKPNNFLFPKGLILWNYYIQ